MKSSSSHHLSPNVNPFVAPEQRRFQFSIASMLAAATLASAFLALITLGERGLPGLFYALLGVLVFRATRPEPKELGSAGAVGRFWRRQFGSPRTGRQLVFDVTFGAIMPLFCLWADFFLFKTPPPAPPAPPDSVLFFRPAQPTLNQPLLWTYTKFAYALIGLEIALLLLWMAIGRWLRSAAGFLGGALLAGCTAAVLLGLLLLPIATMGLVLMLTGALGYTPWLTAFVYYRQGRAALRLALTGFGRVAVICMAFAGSLVVAILYFVLFNGPWLWE